MGKRKGKSKLNNELIIARRRRMFRVEEMLLSGVTSNAQIAIRLGVTPPTIAADIERLMGQWLRTDIRQAKGKQAKRVRQLEFASFQAITAWERSKQNSEEVTTEYQERKCKSCQGTGMVEETDEWCPTCKGNGVVTVEHIVRRIKGQVGDAALLNIYKECVKELARIEGCYPQAKGKVVNKQTNIQINAGGIDYSTAPADQLLEARRALARLGQAITDNRVNGNGTVVDVESKEPGDQK